ncbi:MAG: cell division protein [Gammaproteobacteria bacterium]|jgi:cell division transport system permease protein|nr:cell division protein [Gammaproteobacteria bacterium]
MTEEKQIVSAKKWMSHSFIEATLFRLRQYLLGHYVALRQSAHELRQTQLGTLLTFLMIGVSIALPAGLWTVMHNMKGLTGGLSHNAQISLFLRMDISDNEVENLMNALKSNRAVASAHYISPAEGLKEFSERIGMEGLSDSLNENPLPAVITVEPKLVGENDKELENLTVFLRNLPGVDNATLDFKWLKRLHSLLAIGQRTVYALALLLGLGVLLVVINAIRYLIQRYHKQIQIYQLVGATDPYIRRPFIYMGLQYGFWGGLLAWMMDNLILLVLTPSVRTLADSYSVAFHTPYLGILALLTLLFIGSVLGALGGYSAVNSYLRQQQRA